MHQWLYYQNAYPSAGFNILGFILHLLFWVLVVWLVVSIIKHAAHSETTEENDGESYNYLDIIKKRYAKGEIDRKEYEQLKKDLA